MHLNSTSRAGFRGLIAAWTTSLCACSTTPCEPAMPAPPLPPAACQVECPPVPELIDGSLAGFRRWADDLLNLYHDCRRAKAACAADLDLQ